MKKILIYTFIFSILLYSVIAANVYEAEDFTKHPKQLVILGERDAVSINWDDKKHQVMVRKIYQDQNKIDLTAFIEGAETPFYVSITSKTSLQLDFQQDLEYDMKVSIFNILKEEKTVALTFEKIDKEFSPIIGEIIEKQPENKFYQNKNYLFAGIILLILIIWKRRSILKTYRKLKK